MSAAVQRHLPLLVAGLIVAAGLAIGWRLTLGFKAFTWESYRRLQVEMQPPTLPGIELQTHTGASWQPGEDSDRLRLVNFFYSRCPTLCRYSGTVYARLLETVRQRGWQNHVQLISITLEPDFDLPPRLREYRRRYATPDADLWLTTRSRASEDQQRLLESFGVVSIPDGWGGIQHNAAIHVVDARGKLIRIIDDSDFDALLDNLTPLVEDHASRSL